MTSATLQFSFPTKAEMLSFAAALSNSVTAGAIIFLSGSLGAGKTTFTRGFLRGLGYQDKVKSPTYTIVEPYDIHGRLIHHFDFYRLTEVKELEYIGIKDYFSKEAICIIEWPEKGLALLPTPDLNCTIDFAGEGRTLQIEAMSERGHAILKKLRGI